ncbi:MAG TPA: type II toxin-antitoxin system antitoxin SocA domain-containing protein [Acidobacteriaceae bacterium]|jgi:uncharacterized phage-associated protein|nr:type II toxin-antitoxin system antitoxin SocA domain-containing protein [Acidobacteriaceae bacterium]
MTFKAAAVANEFLRLSTGEGKEMTPLKLQKLVYFAHGWYLALTGSALISEPVQAWRYGPVISSLYREFRDYGNEPIVTPAAAFQMRKGKASFIVERLDNSGADEQEIEKARAVIGRVWQQYGGYSAARLSNATHAPGSPWAQVYEEGRKNVTIPDDKIRTYFQSLANATTR